MTPRPLSFLFLVVRPIARPLVLGLLCLCALVGSAAHAQEPADAPSAFALEVDAPAPLAEGLLRHLELQRYKSLPDLDAGELQRLVAAADLQARELLATWGHFAPQLQWHTETRSSSPVWQVKLTVAPGPQAMVREVHWTFAGHLQDSDGQRAQREALARQWLLPAGQPFTQDAWNAAKAAALRQLTAEHYPLGRIAHSEARVDAEQHRVTLHLTLDSGPEVRLGEVRIEGSERYSQAQALRLANLRPGRPYRQSDLLEAQQRLVLSGFYDAVFVSLDTEGPPEAIPVRIELKETPRQRWQMGVGARSDSGARLTLEHTHHRVPGLDWRASTKLSVDRLLQSLSLDLLAPPDPQLWRWTLAGKAEHQVFSGYEVNSERLRGGRTQLGERIDRAYYLQYDNAETTGEPAGTRNALSAHYAWTWRYFDSLPFPTLGWGLGLEVGGGSTLGAERVPYARSHARALWLLPLDRQGMRLALRGELGAVSTRDAENIPTTQLFVAGGERSVRGYAPGSIGVRHASGVAVAGRYLGVASIEWLQPIRVQQRPTDWDALLFFDAGAVANQPSALQAQKAVGVGARWRSPVGPLEIDLARALDTGRWRLHLSVGFRF